MRCVKTFNGMLLGILVDTAGYYFMLLVTFAYCCILLLHAATLYQLLCSRILLDTARYYWIR
jgi:hypothetical protein